MNWRFIVLTVLLLTGTQITHAAVTPDDPGNFITTWNTENTAVPFSTNNNQIRIPGISNRPYSYEIYWENTASSSMNGSTTLITHSGSPVAGQHSYTLTFPQPGIYEVQISGTFPGILFNNDVGGLGGGPGTDKEKLLTIEQWGNVQWFTMERAFYGCTNLRIPATDAPQGTLQSFASMLRDATSFNDPINHWDVSGSGVFERMFQGASSFNQPLNDWNISVTNGNYMFKDATSFNQPLNEWNFCAGLCFNPTITGMFENAAAFDQDLSEWDISKIVSMTDMFFNTTSSQKNQDSILTGWATQSVQSNVPFHLGLKSYSATGEAALNTLATTYNWDITEQYQATYMPSEDASLIGDNIQQPLDSGATTTAVTLNPRKNCTFIQWSDGNTDNPRQDVLTDNLNVTAELECHSSKNSTSASTQRDKAEKFGNTEQVEFLEERFLTEETTDEERAYQPPATLEESLVEVKELPQTVDIITESDSSPETKQKLTTILLQMIEVLTQLMQRSAIEE